MDSNTPNMGGFGQGIGGNQDILQAMLQHAGGNASILNQVSPAAPGYQPMPAPTQGMGSAMPPQAPSAMPTTPPPPVPADPSQGAAPQGPQLTPGAVQDHIILQALIERLGHNAKLQKALLGR